MTVSANTPRPGHWTFSLFRCVILTCCLIPVISVDVLEAQSDADFASLKPGDQAADWKELMGTDDKPYSLEGFQKDVVVVCFTSNTCPYSVDYEDRMKALQKSFEDEGLSAQLISINSNGVRGDELEAMKKRAMEKQFNFPYLKDESQSVARSYGATYTPEFYVLNKDRTIVYRGAMDDQTDPSKATINYVQDAVRAAINGTLPKVSEVPARGCAVRYKRVRRSKQ
ncbi:MAG: thioredoxin family protein [Planctomycetaceae bacterium]|nr:thioredoxin family protein [Planctomycetaceae bacterium]